MQQTMLIDYKKTIVDTAKTLRDMLLRDFNTEERVSIINEVREILSEASPFRYEPVDTVFWVKADRVQANDYNPNTVAPPEMKLLKLSIQQDGYTQPVVAFREEAEDRDYTVVDGFHRTRVAKESPAIRDRLHGYLPITLINADREDKRDRVAATIRHNRARGKHAIAAMSDIVADLLRRGWSDVQVAKELGMDADEILRFKQHTGLPDLFKNHKYSNAWE